MDANGSFPAPVGQLPVAVDTTGGDAGIAVVVEGAIAACKEFGAHAFLVGPKDELHARLDALGARSLPLTICHAPDIITMDDMPSRAVLRKPNSSLCVAYNLVESGRASSIISAGNSGAMMAAGTIIFGLMPGIKRAAIATLIPGSGNNRPNVILDSGANVDCHAHNLVQFAVMGAIYYTSLFGIERPKVALLSNGTEASKGTDIIRAAALELSRIQDLNYIGYVEGRDVPGGVAEVIVCDGFVGNVVLKAMEGCVRHIANQIIHEGQQGLLRRIALGLSKNVYKEVFSEKFDYTAHGGAPLLGLRKLAIVLHGSSDARAVKNAIRVAENFAKTRMNEKIAAELAQLEDETLGPLEDIFSASLSRRRDFDGDNKREATTPTDISAAEQKGTSDE